MEPSTERFLATYFNECLIIFLTHFPAEAGFESQHLIWPYHCANCQPQTL